MELLKCKGFELRLQPLFLIKSSKVYSGVASTAEIRQSGMIMNDENIKNGRRL
jgi:hypothetical protein